MRLILLALLACCVVGQVQVLDIGADGSPRLPVDALRRISSLGEADTTASRTVRSAAARMVPGDLVPFFSVPVLHADGLPGGLWTYEPSFDNTNAPLLAFAYNEASAFQQTMWETDVYLHELFIESPSNSEYLFLSLDSADALGVASYLYERIQTAMTQLELSEDEKDSWNARIHIGTVNVAQLANSFLPELLHTWQGSVTQVLVRNSFNVYAEHQVVSRLDGRWPWVSSMTSLLGDEELYRVGWFSNGCSNVTDTSLPPPAANVTGTVALIARNGGTCTFEEKIRNAQRAGAIGVMIYSDPGEPLIDVNCPDCLYYPAIPASMISFAAGDEMAQLIFNEEPVSVQFSNPLTDGSFFIVDSTCALQEIGSMQFPSWKFIAWPMQYFNHIHNVVAIVDSESSVQIEIFSEEHMDGPRNSTVTLPLPVSELQQYGTAYLETYLDCYGDTDASCPSWDRTLQLMVCCDEESDLCGKELARWITPFKRRIGHWLTPVHTLLPLLNGRNCTFTIEISTSGGGKTDKWVPSVTLHLDGLKAEPLVPFLTVPLFEGGTWNQTYNERQPIAFLAPPGTQQVILTAVITGHGCDMPNCCAEFCVTQHEFTFNNDTENAISRTFNNAGTAEGCGRRAFMGVEPNEFGTWLYGRNGWCDGQEVIPWEWDVTGQVALDHANSVLYQGYFGGATPDPLSSPGYIIMYSYLTFFQAIS